MEKKKMAKSSAGTAVLALAALAVLACALVMLPGGPTQAGLAAYTVADPAKPGWFIHYVDDWASFIAAWNSNAAAVEPCSKIVLLNDINQPNATESAGGTGVSAHSTHRTAAIEIDGRNPVGGTVYRLHVGSVQLVLAETTAVPYESMLHVHDIILRQNIDTANAPIEQDRFIFRCGTGGQGASNNGRWILRFGNISAPPREIVNINRSGFHHLAFAYGSAMEFYGTNYFAVGEEFVHCSSVEIEDDTILIAHKTSRSDTSMFYYYHGFNLSSGPAVDRGSGFRIGDRCTVVTYNDQGGTTYPSVYYRYSFMEVGENSTFAATMTGNAFRAQFSDTTHFTVGSGSVINLTSVNQGEVAFNTTSATRGFRFESAPGAEIYIVGYNTNTTAGSGGVVNLSGGSSSNPDSFIINEPKFFDLRNKAQENSLIFVSAANNTITVNDTDIDIWYTRSYATNPYYAPHSAPANLYVMDAGYYQLTNTASATQVSTSEPELLPMRSDRYNRISGGKNRLPEVVFEIGSDPLLNTPTDADKFVRVRAILAWTPHDDGVDINGNVEMVPIYAPPGQIKVWLASQDGNPDAADDSGLPGAVQFLDPEDGLLKWFLPIDANGYLLLPNNYPVTKLDEFLQAGTLLSAKALRHNAAFLSGGANPKTRLGEEFTASVKDVTPPVPAEINGLIMRGDTEISGRNGEPGAKVTFVINPGPGEVVIDAGATVDGAGDWKIVDLLTAHGVNLATGGIVRIFMEDSHGNRNPEPGSYPQYPADQPYSDAFFPPAPDFAVHELPALLHVRQVVMAHAATMVPLAGEENRSVPDTGYVTVVKRDSGNAPLEAVNMFVHSGTDEGAVGYTLFTYPPNSDIGKLQVQVADPQYYEYAGYRMSGSEMANGAAAFSTGYPELMVGAQAEEWITLYVQPRANATAYYAKEAVDNGLGDVHLPVPPAMSLSAYNTTEAKNIGYIAQNGTIRVPGQNTAQTIAITAQAWGDGIGGDCMDWTRLSNPSWASMPPSVSNTNTLVITIPSGNQSGSMKIRAESVDDPALRMEFTIQVIDLIITSTEYNVEMTPNYTIYLTSSPAAAKVLSFTASKAVDWGIRSQTGVRAALGAANGAANTLTIPANYRGTINLRVTSSGPPALTRNFRVVVSR